MRGWVKWICQVCCLHETRAPELNLSGQETIQEVPQNDATAQPSTLMLNNNNALPSPGISLYSNMYQNSDLSFRSSGVNEYCNRETILISESQKFNTLNNNSINQFDRSIAEAYTNFSTIERASIERSHSLRAKTMNSSGGASSHSRTQSLDEHGAMLKQQQKKYPENLRHLNVNTTGDKKPSPALSSSSGPYIPISECFSGGAYRVDKQQQSFSSSQYSPKSGQNMSDSESVFTDDEWTHPVMPHHTLTRNKLQSETSLDKDQLTWAYVQRFSKTPGRIPPPRPPKRSSGIYSANSNESGINNKESPLPSPSAFIGPKDRQSSVIEERYDIPRSHNIPKNLYDNGLPTPGFSPLDAMNVIASSTPNLIHDSGQGAGDGSRTLPHSRQNFYTNAAPSNVEGYIFRYDFSDQVSFFW